MPTTLQLSHALNTVLQCLHENFSDLSIFWSTLLGSHLPAHNNIVMSLRIEDILNPLYTNSVTRPSVKAWICREAEIIYASEVRQIAGPKFGLRFNATHLRVQQIQQFSFMDLASKLEKDTPALWNKTSQR